MEMLERFGSSCDLIQARHINWAQSFARRGYLERDYVHEHSEPLRDSIEHGFRRAAGADPKLPEVLAFLDPWVGTISDGDVLFYYSKISVLHARRVFVTEVGPKLSPEGLLQWSLSRIWICNRTDASAASNLIRDPSMLARFHAGVLDTWDDARSFLAVTL
jgi:hypothetical protein